MITGGRTETRQSVGTAALKNTIMWLETKVFGSNYLLFSQVRRNNICSTLRFVYTFANYAVSKAVLKDKYFLNDKTQQLADLIAYKIPV